MEQYVKLIVDAGGGNNPCVEAYCLDPSLGTEILNCFHSTIHMSGTLEPLEEYRDSIGLHEKTELVSFRSSFPSKNRRVLFVDDVSTKYDDIIKDESMINRMIDQVTSICNNFPKNTMVFFPSFNIMNMFRFNDDIKKITRSVFFEEQKMSQSALMDLVSDFKDYGSGINEGAALFSVMGGRISEGMDFPAEQLEIALIVGIPYPKPTARQRGLKRYYDLKFRKGWEYTVEAPTARKLLQSIGRLIRDEKDRGIAVILDRRAPRFKKYITDLVESKNVLEDIQKFLDR
jgi:DNA excision repair protein ERCC-2